MAKTYQWKKAGSPITGATSTTFGIARATLSDAGVYSIDVTDDSYTPPVTRTFSVIQVINAGTPAYAAGNPQASWVADINVSGGTSGSGRTLVQTGPNNRKIRRTGDITGVRIKTSTFSRATGFTIRVYRWDGSVYQFVNESQTLTLPTGAAEPVYTFNSPLPARAGDALGIYLAHDDARLSLTCKTVVGSTVLFADGKTASTSGNSTLSDLELNIEALGPSLDLAITGDSIVEGHNGTLEYHGFLHTAELFGGDEDCEPGAQIRALRGDWYYENHALGGQTFSWVASTGVPSCLVNETDGIWIHCGVNDVATGRTWSQIETNLGTIRSAITVGKRLYISEILPWTAGNDSQAATIRTFNTNLAAWCAANSATLIECHDAMGQIRPSTGELDDLKTAYDEDGVHLTEEGVAEFAAIVSPQIL